MKDKINLLLKPFVATALLLIIGYTFLNWLLVLELRVISPTAMVTNMVIPMVLAGLAAVFFIRPRLKGIKLKRTNVSDGRDAYCLILWMIFSIPLIIAQEYIEPATGRLTRLDSINDIHRSAPTKYYTIKRYFIQKNNPTATHTAFDVGGRNNERFNMSIYVALPIFETASDTGKNDPLAWLGIVYSQSISNRLTPSEKEEKYKAFAAQSERKFQSSNVSQFVYLSRLRNSDKRTGFIEAVKKSTMYTPNEEILEGVNEPFEARNGNTLRWFFISVIAGSLLWSAMVLIPRIDESQLKRIKAGTPDKTAQKKLIEFIAFSKPRKGYFITPILIYVNLAVYALMVIKGLGIVSFKAHDLLQLGANYGPLTKSGEWWRLLTSIFLHGGMMHLLANIYGLIFIGIFLEPVLGRTKYLTCYLATGILASVASIWWYNATVSVGASGAIFGLYGLFLALMAVKAFPAAVGKLILISTSAFIGLSLLAGLAGGIDNAAHIGGLASGFVAGLIISPIIKEQLEAGGDMGG